MAFLSSGGHFGIPGGNFEIPGGHFGVSGGILKFLAAIFFNLGGTVAIKSILEPDQHGGTLHTFFKLCQYIYIWTEFEKSG